MGSYSHSVASSLMSTMHGGSDVKNKKNNLINAWLHACEYEQNSKLPLSEIHYSVGFRQQNNF